MDINHKGTSTLENVTVVILVTMSIVMSWDLGSQLIGGGIKNLVSQLEEPNPHKYVIQSSPGVGISVPGCSCTPWVEACNLASGNKCGNDLMKAKWRTCLPEGCENAVNPPLQTLICDFSDPACCTTPTLFPGGVPISCGWNAVCNPPPSGTTPVTNCSPDGKCPDDTGLYIQECQNPGQYSYECRLFSGCQFNCSLKPEYAQWCTAAPGPRPPQNFDHRRLRRDNTPVTLLDTVNQCATSQPACSPSSLSLSNRCCRSYCPAPYYIRNPITNLCVGCPANTALRGNCAANFCIRGTCPAGSCLGFSY